MTSDGDIKANKSSSNDCYIQEKIKPFPQMDYRNSYSYLFILKITSDSLSWHPETKIVIIFLKAHELIILLL